jgi:Xaa-Pro aminopeptidase
VPHTPQKAGRITTSPEPGSRAGLSLTPIVPGSSITSARLVIARNYVSVSGATGPSSSSSRRNEVEAKLALVRDWLDRRSLPAVALTTQPPVAWLTAGLTNPIDRSDPASPLWLVVTPDRVVGVTTAVERPRLLAEAGLDEVDFSLEDVPWFDGTSFVRAVEDIAGAGRTQLASDGHPELGIDADSDLTALRLRLEPAECERLVHLGRDAARAVEHAASAWQPGERDFDVQARVAEQLERCGALPHCLIVGGDDRVERFRHPLAAGAPVQRLLMVVVVAMRGGLHVAATRFARANSLPDAAQEAFEKALEVEAAMLVASRPGGTYGDVMRACEDAYAQVGHPGAWHEHYQGGPIGYRQREFEIAPVQHQSRWFSQPIEPGHAVAWNPSVAGGGKSEDTFLVEDGGLRCVTETGAWPRVEVRGGRRTGILNIAR